MKQFFKMFFASLLAMIVAGVIVFGVLVGLIVSAVSKSVSTESHVRVSSNSVLVVDLSNAIHEQSESNSLAILSDDNGFSTGIYDITKAIAKAKEDKDIKGILIKMAPSPNGWATIQQLRTALVDFKGSGKFVYAYGEQVTQGAYYVASAADSVYLNPMGDMELKGFATILAFFKGTLEKLEVEPEIFYAGKFKSATEPFRTDKMSDANRLQVTEFMTDFWTEFTTTVAPHAHTDAATINQLAVTGAIQFPEDALKNKLVDGLMYWDQVEGRIKAQTGTKEKETIKYISLDDYAQHVKGDIDIKDNKIAILMAEGAIVDGESDNDHQIASKDMAEVIRKIRNNDKIKAVVLRVNSPGGSALASEVILRELELLNQKKPLVVSMGDYAASGGYFIASQADSIFALPTTITGSIGVFGMMFNGENLMKNKLGVTFDGVKNAPFADFPAAYRPMTADEKVRMQNSVDKIYTIFKGHVAKGRRMNPEIVDSIAQGRVWSGTDAKQNGLVDAIGGLDRALSSASKLAKISDYQVVTYPSPKDKFETMIKKMTGGNSETGAAMKMMLEKEMGSDYEYYKQVKALRNMNGKTMMAMPFVLKVN